MKKALALALALGLGLVVAGCGDGGKAVADAAIKATDTAFNAVKDEALRYVPDQVPSIETAMNNVHDEFTKGNYQQAMADAKALLDKVNGLKDAAAAKKAEMTKAWEGMAGMPQVVEAIQSRVDILSQAKKLPRGMTTDSFGAAKAGLDTIKSGWAEATNAAGAGNMMEAVAKATPLKAKAAEVMTALGMTVPDALK